MPKGKTDAGWPIKFKCPGCRKGMIDTGRCYTCSTGKSRVILRRDEKAGDVRNDRRDAFS